MLSTRIKLFIVLAGVFSTCLVVGDIIGGKLVQTQLFEQTITLTVGMIPFPVTFLLTDLLNEFYGKRAARFVTWLGFGLAILAYLFIYVAAKVPIAAIAQAPDWRGVNEAAFQNVFMGSLRMIIASLAAYLIAQFADIFVFHWLRNATKSRFLWLRATGSTVISQAIDTLTISLIAWWGLLSGGELLNIMLSSYSVKFLIALGLTPAIYAAHAVVERLLRLDPTVDLPPLEVRAKEQAAR